MTATRMISKRLAALAAGAALAGFALAGAPANAQTIAIMNGEVHTVGAAGVIENGDVIIKDGRIAAVGADLDAPAGAQVIDASGKIVTPGFFAPFTGVGLTEISLDRESNDIEANDSFPLSAALDALDAFDPDSTVIPVTRAGGVTHVYVAALPGGDLFGGRGAVVDMGGGTEPVTKAEAGLTLALGYQGAARSGDTRMGSWAKLRGYLDAALAYDRDPRGYSDRADAERFEIANLRALAPAAKGEVPLLVFVQRASEIRQVIDLKAKYGLKIAIVGGDEAWRVAADLAAANIPVILDPMQNLPDSFESLGATLESAARLDKAGVKVAFFEMDNAFTANARLLPQLAGNAVANGMPHEAALRAVTRTPAEIYGVSDRLGSLEAGKNADVVVWDGDPFELSTYPATVIINGKPASLDNRQTALRDRYRTLERGDLPYAYRGGQ